MKRTGSFWRQMVLATLAASAVAGCEGKEAEGGGEISAPVRHQYVVQLTGTHAHILKEVTLSFAVMRLDDCADLSDVMSCPMVAGLPVTVFYQYAKDAEATAVSAAPGVLEDMGDGTYAWHHAFTGVGAYVVGVGFEQEGQTYSFAFPFETSRAGGERYFCNTTPGADSVNDFAYQIRWSPSKGDITADAQEVAFSIELMRSFNTPIDETTPWTNKFDHLRPADLAGSAPTVELMAGESGQASSVATLTPTYLGKGIYEVRRAFTHADLGPSMAQTFWLKITFTDDQGCTINGGATDAVDYYFPVEMAH